MTYGEKGHGGLGDFRVPDYTKPVRGYRKFTMSPDGWLRGVTFPYRWTPDVNEAECWLRRMVKGVTPQPNDPAFLAPSVGLPGGIHVNPDGSLVTATGYEPAPCPGVARGDHGCGFYARHGGKIRYEMYGYDFTVSGVVDLWGSVELGPDGVRAQFARIVALNAYWTHDHTQRAINRHLLLLDDAEKNLNEADEHADWPALAARVDRERDMVTLLSSGPGRWAQVAEHYPVPVFHGDDEMLAEFEVPDLTEMIANHAEES